MGLSAGRPVVDVAVGVLTRSDGRVLMAQRLPGKAGAGSWEFPGGQIDPGESAAEAAARELLEEVGVHAHVLEPWRCYEHDFVRKRVRLTWFRVVEWSGEPRGVEGQRVAWVDPQSPGVAPVLASNQLALTVLGLPNLVAVATVGREPDASRSLVARVPLMVDRGLRLMVVRASHLAPAQRVQLAGRLRQTCGGTPLRVVLSGTSLESSQSGADGLHSSAAALAGLGTRPRTELWVVSAHSATQVSRADALGADVALVSPVLPTVSHPGLEALGWAGLRELVAASRLPVYAQGGLGPEHLQTARAAGAVGVAVDAERLDL